MKQSSDAARVSEREREKTMDEVKVFEDPVNWKLNRLPCKADRIIFPETVSVIINSSVSAREIVLPFNGAIIFGEKASVELFENSADDSCPGVDMLFTATGSSHWDRPQVYSFGRLLLQFFVVAVVCALALALYLNLAKGVRVQDVATVVVSGVRQVSGRLSHFYVQSPGEGTYNFVRFQGHDDNIELELGAQPGSEALARMRAIGATVASGSAQPPGPSKSGHSLRGVGFLMSDIEEVEEDEVEKTATTDEFPDDEADVVAEPTDALEFDSQSDSDQKNLLD